MPNAPLIIETALLLLAAFLIGCVAGYGLRRLTAGRQKAEGARTVAAPPAAPAAQEQLVVAPTIAPVAAVSVPEAKPGLPRAASTPAEPQGTAATEPVVAPLPAVEHVGETIQPARVAGQTTSGKLLPRPVEPPVAPEVVPEEPERPVVASEVPPIDEAAHVVDADGAPPAETVPASAAPAAAAVSGIAWSQLSGVPEEEFRSRLDAESEQAAMRAIEGGWTPRPAPRAQPVELPEPIRDVQPSAPREPAAATNAADVEVAGALSAVRSAVASASAAAQAALAQHADAAMPAPTEEEPAPDQTVQGEAREHSPFGRPAGLAAPREGGKDELRQIRGMTPQAEAALNALGIFHFDQIAAWDRKESVWVDTHLGLRGGVARDKWIEQARELAKARAPGFRAASRR